MRAFVMDERAKARFWARVDKEGPVPEHVPHVENCWVWIGKRRPDGRGVMTICKADLLIHRVSWEIHSGSPPGEMCVLHRCDNPSCVRPDHLFIGTQMDNLRDMHAKKRGRNPPVLVGERNPRTRFTNEMVMDIRQKYVDGATQVALAKLFGVRQTTISRIVLNQRWAHLPRTAELRREQFGD